MTVIRYIRKPPESSCMRSEYQGNGGDKEPLRDHSWSDRHQARHRHCLQYAAQCCGASKKGCRRFSTGIAAFDALLSMFQGQLALRTE